MLQVTPTILILSGPPAAGKSTMGPLIAKDLERCAVIDVDLLRTMVVQPHIAPWLGEIGMAQLRLGAYNGCAVARNCVDHGYAAVLLDVLTDETAAIYHRELQTYQHQIVLLLPTLAAALQRNRERGQFLTDDEVSLLYQWQLQLTDYDVRFDNTTISAPTLAVRLAQYIKTIGLKLS